MTRISRSHPLTLALLIVLTGSAFLTLSPRSAHAKPTVEAWIKQCHSDYADFQKKWTPVVASTRETLQELKGASFYVAYPRLVALYATLQEQGDNLGFNRGVTWQMARRDGIAHTVLARIVSTFRDFGLSYSNPLDRKMHARGYSK